jgi:hypothetical protein
VHHNPKSLENVFQLSGLQEMIPTVAAERTHLQNYEKTIRLTNIAS